MEELLRLFYFVVFPAGDKSRLQVIDLDTDMRYERSEWSCVNNRDFEDRAEAIQYARDLAAHHSLIYVPFESRYNKETNEGLRLPGEPV